MPHHLRSLVRSSVCAVEHCTECDVLHLTLGPMTVRLEIGATRKLAAALHEALARLDASADRPGAHAPNVVLPN